MSAALIATVENFRDDSNLTDTGFHIDVQAGALVSTAYDYLADGTMTCTCPPCDLSCCAAEIENIRAINAYAEQRHYFDPEV